MSNLTELRPGFWHDDQYSDFGFKGNVSIWAVSSDGLPSIYSDQNEHAIGAVCQEFGLSPDHVHVHMVGFDNREGGYGYRVLWRKKSEV